MRRRLIVGALLLWELTSPLRIPVWLAVLRHMVNSLYHL